MNDPRSFSAPGTLSLPTTRDERTNLLEMFALGLVEAQHPDDREFGEAILWLLKSEDALFCVVRHLSSHTLALGELHKRARAARAFAELRS